MFSTVFTDLDKKTNMCEGRNISDSCRFLDGPRNKAVLDGQGEGSELLKWSVKTIKSPPKEVVEMQLLIFGVGTGWGLYGAWLVWDSPSFIAELIFGFVLSYSISFLLVILFRQKTVFNYKITSLKGLLEYYRYYPDFAGPFFKGIAIFTILLFLGVALVTGSLLFLIGPVAISLVAARSLLSWENKINNEQSLPWNEYNFVAVDRKRSMIITHRTDITVGFEARFPNKELFEQYLQFLHSVLPSTAEFMEKDWEW